VESSVLRNVSIAIGRPGRDVETAPLMVALHRLMARGNRPRWRYPPGSCASALGPRATRHHVARRAASLLPVSAHPPAASVAV